MYMTIMLPIGCITHIPNVISQHKLKCYVKENIEYSFCDNEGTFDKLEYWKKYKLFDLIIELKKAHEILLNQDSGCSENFNNPQEFAQAIDEIRDDIEFGNQTNLIQIWKWFAPTCDWDDMVSENHQDLANKIFEICNFWYRNERISSAYSYLNKRNKNT